MPFYAASIKEEIGKYYAGCHNIKLWSLVIEQMVDYSWYNRAYMLKYIQDTMTRSLLSVKYSNRAVIDFKL